MTRIFLIVAAAMAAAAAPAAPERREPRPAAPPTVERQRPVPRQEVPGIILIGMGATGLAIVGVSSRRRQPGRQVTD